MMMASKFRVLRVIPLLLIMILFCPCTNGKIIYVNNDGQADFDNIQTGINAAIDGDTVLVAPGTYTGQLNRDINFWGKAITVCSTDPNDPLITASTIIDCQDKARGFTFESGEQADSILEGITIINGRALNGGGIFIRNSSPTISNCTIKNNNNISTGPDRDGGGIFIYDGSPTIFNCIISGNSAARHGNGGGVYIQGDNQESRPKISQCSIIGNTAGSGGGLYIHYSSPVISHCTITDNYAIGSGGLRIGGMGSPDENIVRVENCRISNNSANSSSGGLYTTLCTLRISNCVVSGNCLLYGGAGGGLSIRTWTIAEIDQCTIVGNKVVQDPPGVNCVGGGLYFQMCDVKISNSIIRRNRATKGAQLAIHAWDGVQSPNMPPIEDPTLVTLHHNDFNSEQDQELYIYGEPNLLTLEIDSNLDVDPCFADPGFWDPNGTPEDPNDDFWVEGDYHLKSKVGRWNPISESWVQDDVTSSCIDAGDPNSPIGHEPFPNGGIINMGAYGGTAEASKSLSGKSIYVFWPGQSMLIQTGGIAGVNRTYTLAGQFQLIIDYGAGKARLSNVEAIATGHSEPVSKLDPNDVFNLTGLTGTISKAGHIQFTGRTADESDVLLYLTLSDEWISLKGQTTPPPDSADFYIFELDAVAQRKYGGGIGERNNPFLIHTAEQLNAIGAEPNDWDKHFKLMADIELSGYSYEAALIAPDVDPCEPGFQGISFTGVLEGNGHKISNLTITSGDYVGLFGQTELGAEIENLGIVDVNITGSDYVGGFVGFSKGNISTCYCTGTISGDQRVGGITGRNWSNNITACYSTATITANSDAGGIAANNYGSITNCYNAGVVTSYRDAGGLVGENYGTVDKCYSTGTVSGDNRPGGLVSSNWPDTGIVSGFWDVETSGQSSSDGGVGKTTAEMQMAATFLDVGWDFMDETANGTEDIWWILEGRDYPRLWWETE